MAKLFFFLFIFPLSVFSQNEIVFVLTNGAKLTEEVHSKLINQPYFSANYRHEIIDSLVQNDTLFYSIKIEKKREIKYKNMFVLFEYNYIPFNEYDFSESQLFIDSLEQITAANYYLNRRNILFEMNNYSYAKDSYNENEFHLKSSYTVYKNKEIVIVEQLNNNYAVLIKAIDDSLFQKLHLFSKERTVLQKSDPNFGISHELMDQWTSIQTESSQFSFLSFDNLKKDYFALFKEVRNVPWKNSFNTLIEEKKYNKLAVYKQALIKNHEQLKLPIHKIEYPAPRIEIKE